MFNQNKNSLENLGSGIILYKSKKAESNQWDVIGVT